MTGRGRGKHGAQDPRIPQPDDLARRLFAAAPRPRATEDAPLEILTRARALAPPGPSPRASGRCAAATARSRRPVRATPWPGRDRRTRAAPPRPTRAETSPPAGGVAPAGAGRRCDAACGSPGPRPPPRRARSARRFRRAPPRGPNRRNRRRSRRAPRRRRRSAVRTPREPAGIPRGRCPAGAAGSWRHTPAGSREDRPRRVPGRALPRGPRPEVSRSTTSARRGGGARGGRRASRSARPRPRRSPRCA